MRTAVSGAAPQTIAQGVKIEARRVTLATIAVANGQTDGRGDGEVQLHEIVVLVV